MLRRADLAVAHGKGHYDKSATWARQGLQLRTPMIPTRDYYYYPRRCRLAPVPLDGDFSRGEKTASTRGSGGPASLQPSNLNRPHGGEVGFGMAGPESASCRLLFFFWLHGHLYRFAIALCALDITAPQLCLPTLVAGYYPSGYYPSAWMGQNSRCRNSIDARSPWFFAVDLVPTWSSMDSNMAAICIKTVQSAQDICMRWTGHLTGLPGGYQSSDCTSSTHKHYSLSYLRHHVDEVRSRTR